MIVRETYAKAILSDSKIYEYALNPYTGGEHACSYCYASFMKRFTGHREPWGEFVDVKVNAAALLVVELEVGLSITTADDKVRELFEPRAPTIEGRLRALSELHLAGVATVVMIAPLLRGSEELPALVAGKADYVPVDRMNYACGDWVYRKYGLEDKRCDGFFEQTAQELVAACDDRGIPCRVVF